MKEARRKQLDWDAALFNTIASTIEGIILLTLLPPEIRSVALETLSRLSMEPERVPVHAAVLQKLVTLIEEVADVDVSGVRK